MNLLKLFAISMLVAGAVACGGTEEATEAAAPTNNQEQSTDAVSFSGYQCVATTTWALCCEEGCCNFTTRSGSRVTSSYDFGDGC